MMKQFDEVTATFQPKRTDDLRPDAHQFIGQTFRWIATHVIEEGPYASQWSFMPTDDKFPRPVFNVAEGDLKIVGCCADMDWSGCDQTQPHHPRCEMIANETVSAEFELHKPAGLAYPTGGEYWFTYKGLASRRVSMDASDEEKQAVYDEFMKQVAKGKH
jgi:hypothetical protein